MLTSQAFTHTTSVHILLTGMYYICKQLNFEPGNGTTTLEQYLVKDLTISLQND